ncbi:MAG: DUF72 domain-containing protein [Deltaproteobacteria bacterium]|nr:DUF72 domain-containing protein [Candidatus Anaeroferrophillacea bacterium]
MAKILVGTSGWSYDHWRHSFYGGQPRRRWLEFYAATFATVEVNATFYRAPTETMLASWRRRTPPGFVMALKAHRLITHRRRLRDAADPVRRMLERQKLLGDRLGPVLFQLPPSLPYDRTDCEAFLALLPRSRRFALEARHPSWARPGVFRYLRDAGVAWCIGDSGGRFTACREVTADFAYVRLHGSGALYASSYDDAALRKWAADICSLEVPAYVYFNNDAEGIAPENARRLQRLLASSAS